MNQDLTAMEKRFELSLLYDFYGELLKENQKKIFEAYIGDDYSLAEIAQEYGISRQGIHDTVKRCTRQLEEFEEKLHLAARFQEAAKTVHRIQELAENVDFSEEKAENQSVQTELQEKEAARVEALAEIRKLSEYLLELL